MSIVETIAEGTQESIISFSNEVMELSKEYPEIVFEIVTIWDSRFEVTP